MSENLLYSIQFLHQITTEIRNHAVRELLYSIQFLHQITTRLSCGNGSSALYSIQFLHQITTRELAIRNLCCCIVSNFYIKSQQLEKYTLKNGRCIVSNFYIKSQPADD